MDGKKPAEDTERYEVPGGQPCAQQLNPEVAGVGEER